MGDSFAKVEKNLSTYVEKGVLLYDTALSPL
jgi:hypothetical protein